MWLYVGTKMWYKGCKDCTKRSKQTKTHCEGLTAITHKRFQKLMQLWNIYFCAEVGGTAASVFCAHAGGESSKWWYTLGGPWWTQVDPPSMAWDPPGGPNWKLPGVVHTHPEVRQQWVNTAEGMQEARIRAKHLEKQTTRMQGWVCERVQYRGTKYTKTKEEEEEGTWGDLPGIVNMWLVSRDMLALQ